MFCIWLFFNSPCPKGAGGFVFGCLIAGGAGYLYCFFRVFYTKIANKKVLRKNAYLKNRNILI
jgi:hypothetical protein